MEVDADPVVVVDGHQPSLPTAAAATDVATTTTAAAPTYSDEELETTLRVLRALGQNPHSLTGERFIEVRVLCGQLSKRMHQNNQERRALRKAQKRKRMEEDRAKREQTQLRKKRTHASMQASIMCLPSPELAGAIERPALTSGGATIETLVAEEEETSPSKEREKEMEIEVAKEEEEGDKPAEFVASVRRQLTCYICKNKFKKLHFFYDLMCPECAETNYAKRIQTADLTGRIALVTGGRIKIGYEIVVKLLRCGATVIVTTRFPKDSLMRFAKAEDFSQWKDRLHIYGLDLRQLGELHQFIDVIKSTFTHLDIIINNAAQTVRRPPSFYAHIIPTESLSLEQLPQGADSILNMENSKPAIKAAPTSSAFAILDNATSSVASTSPISQSAASQLAERFAQAGVSPSAILSVTPLVAGDDVHDRNLFPPNCLDADLQQIDLRAHNSWVTGLEDVNTTELLEVTAINSLAPFIINSRLKEMLLRKKRDSYIVNVSALEGQFYRVHKTAHHPHTNMAKAALNMMTRTSAGAFAKESIFMTAVDTGWINDESPHQIATENATRGFSPPLDNVDAAMRVLDPILHPIRTGEPAMFGCFIKDYAPSPW